MAKYLTLLSVVTLVCLGALIAPQFTSAYAQDPHDTPPEPVIDCEEVDCSTICEDLMWAELDFVFAEIEFHSANAAYTEARNELAAAREAYWDARLDWEYCTGNCSAERAALAQATQDRDAAEIEADLAQQYAQDAKDAYTAAGEAYALLVRQKNQCCPDTVCD